MQIFAQGLLQVHSISVSDATTIAQLKGLLSEVSVKEVHRVVANTPTASVLCIGVFF